MLLSSDGNGEFFSLTVVFASKNHADGVRDTETGNAGRIQHPEQVEAIKLLLSKLNAGHDHLFQRAKSNFEVADKSWFFNLPLGKNVQGKMMTRISEKAELSRVYTNHSVRATAITHLSSRGVQDRHIVAITGHRNHASLASYTKPTGAQRARMAAILDGELSSSEDEFAELDRTLEMVSTDELEKLERTPSQSTPAVRSPTMPIHLAAL